MERIIRVTGKGSISLEPDVIKIYVTLKDSRINYEETILQSAKQTELLRDSLLKIGFDKEDLKTLSFKVDTKYESYQDEDKEWKRQFEGYEFTHKLILGFKADSQRLGKTLYALSQCTVSPEISIVYAVGNVEAAKRKMLETAVADSKIKASLLARAAGVELGEIISIDYSWNEIKFEKSVMDKFISIPKFLRTPSDSNEAYNMDIVPDNIERSDTVTVIWSIK